MKPELLSCENGLWAVTKPSGFLAHSAGSDDEDLPTWCIDALDAPDTIAPIHRLDKETSGILLLGESAEVRANIAKWFASCEVSKSYYALVYGIPHKKGVIRRKLKDGRRGKALEAVTRYKRLEVFGSCSLLSVRPETGRKHQIRRHLQSIGHGVAGDERYPNRKRIKIPAFPKRLWLHCSKLELPDGREFVSELPPELEEHLQALRDLRNHQE